MLPPQEFIYREQPHSAEEVLIEDRCCANADALATGISGLEGPEPIAPATLNQALVRFIDPGPDASQSAHNRFTEEMIAAINAEGTAFSVRVLGAISGV